MCVCLLTFTTLGASVIKTQKLLLQTAKAYVTLHTTLQDKIMVVHHDFFLLENSPLRRMRLNNVRQYVHTLDALWLGYFPLVPSIWRAVCFSCPLGPVQGPHRGVTCGGSLPGSFRTESAGIYLVCPLQRSGSRLAGNLMLAPVSAGSSSQLDLAPHLRKNLHTILTGLAIGAPSHLGEKNPSHHSCSLQLYSFSAAVTGPLLPPQ